MKNFLYIVLVLYVFFIVVYTVAGKIIKKRRYARTLREYEINFEVENSVIPKKRKYIHKK